MAARKKATRPAAGRRRPARKTVRTARTTGDMLRETWDAEMARARRRIDGGVGDIAARLDQERKTVARALDSAVHGALASFDIPSRREVTQLTRKVEELSRRIEGLRAPARRAPARKRRTARD